MDRSSEELSLLRRCREAVPAALLEALADAPGYLVGGAVRDGLRDREPAELDIAVDGELDPVLDRLGVEARSHERFGTASLAVGGRQVDLARTRRERYPRPGALPEVSPAPIRVDLARRDFTINAMALPLRGEIELIDPYDGQDDLRAGVLRVIHPGSFSDDPTRGLRAARYLVRLGLTLDPETERLLRASELGAVSDDRVEADLRRLAEEPGAVEGFRLLDVWGLLELGPQRLALLETIAELTLTEPWSALIERPEALLDAARCDPDRLRRARALAATDATQPPSALFEAAERHDIGLQLLARGLGATWLDQHVSEWRRVRLSIDGSRLIEAGIAEGPAIGIGLNAALAARIDGRLDADPAAELEIALGAIRDAGRI